MKDLIDFLTSFTVCSGDTTKKRSENDQSTGHFKSFFSAPNPESEKKNPLN